MLAVVPCAVHILLFYMAYIYGNNFGRYKLLTGFTNSLWDRLPYSPYYISDRHGNLTHYTYTMMFCDAAFYVLYTAALMGLLHYGLYCQGLIP